MLPRSIHKIPIAIFAVGLLFAVNASSALAAPTVTTLAATEVAGTSATLNGTVAADSGHKTNYTIAYGKSPSMSEWTNDTGVKTTESSSPIEVNAPVTGLDPETTYYFAIVAFDVVTPQIAFGDVRSFKTTANLGISFMAAEYPATISGSLGSEIVFQAAGGNFEVRCSTRTLSGTLSGPSSSFTLNPNFGASRSCSSTLGEMTVKMNSCSFVVSANQKNPETYSGGIVISCATAGDAIEFVSSLGPIVKVGPSTLSGTATSYVNTGPATSRQMSVDGHVNFLRWTCAPRFSCNLAGVGASGEDGTIGPGLVPPNTGIRGTVLSGTNSRGTYNEFYIAG
ncbi:MAG TPA: hypothetical protein VNM89_08390 [Solirubrobacterales bacterium]|nr:hypothetical protein [Solirubrobacterales bacterium]